MMKSRDWREPPVCKVEFDLFAPKFGLDNAAFIDKLHIRSFHATHDSCCYASLG